MRASALAVVLLLLGGGLAPVSASGGAGHTDSQARDCRSRQAGLGQGSRAGSDFNGDGYADLAVRGMHYASNANLPHWVVSVIYGSPHGLTVARNQVWRQLDFPDEATPLRLVGDIAAGDFDGDGFTDLAVGLYPSDPEVAPLTGAVRILYGSGAGLQRGRSQLWTSASPGLPAFAGSEDSSFGSSLVAANFGRSGHDDLAIGAAERDGGGQVTVMYGLSDWADLRGQPAVVAGLTWGPG